jgi:hypothetical protein
MKWIVPLMGFREDASRRTGMERLWSDLRRFASPSCTVLAPWEWRDNMRSLAAFIARNSPWSVPRLFVFAYSWGGGYAFPRLARECERLGLTIETACLCDPVYRSGLLPWWLPFNPISLTRQPLIEIPGSVQTVYWVRQHTNLPAAHEVYPADPEYTDVAPPVVIEATHTTIDDARPWRALVMREAEAFVKGDTCFNNPDKCCGGHAS